MSTMAEQIANATSQNELSSLLASDKFGIYPASAYLTIDGATDDYTPLYNLINTTINGDDAEIWFPDGTCLIGTSITIPSNVKLKSLEGGMLKPSSGVAITGSSAKIEAGLTQIFDLSDGGTIEGTWNNLEVYPQWFGEIATGDDTSIIQNAIDFAYNNGGGFVVLNKTSTEYIFTTLTNKTNVTIKGNGGVLKLKDNTCVDAGISYYLLKNIGYDNCIYDGLIIDGNRANNLLYTVADGITVTGENSIVKNCWLYDIPDSGIMFSQCQNSIVENNRIDTVGDLGIYVNDGDGTNHYENIVSHNRITDAPSGGIGLKRVCQHTIVSENTIYDCGNGVTLEQGSVTDYSLNLTITNNRIRNVESVGIILRNSPHCNVVGNRIENFGVTGLSITGDTYNSSIIGNVITTNDVDIAVDGSVRAGILINGRDGAFPSYNAITGNTVNIDRATASNVYGTWFYSGVARTSGGNYNVFSNNIVVTNSKHGLRIDDTYDYNTFSYNILRGDNTSDLYYNTNTSLNNLINNTFVSDTVIGNISSTKGTVLGFIGEAKIANGTVEPASQSWNVGDVVYNTSPTVGDAIGWICTSSGTPGTWAEFGVINLQGSITWNPGSLNDGAGETSSDITISGASLGDFAVVSAPYDLQELTCNAYVSATNTVKIRIQNETGGVVNLGSGTWRIKIIKR